MAVVTGAGRGIGRGHALELAKRGAHVVVNDLGTSVRGEGKGRDADNTVDLITARGGSAVADYGDVSKEEEVDALIEQPRLPSGDSWTFWSTMPALCATLRCGTWKQTPLMPSWPFTFAVPG